MADTQRPLASEEWVFWLMRAISMVLQTCIPLLATHSREEAKEGPPHDKTNKIICAPSKDSAVSESGVEDPFHDLFIDEGHSSSDETETKRVGDRCGKELNAALGDSKSVKQREGERRHWHKKGKKLSKTEIDTESESAGTSLTESRMESQKIFPNYLIAMQITNPKIYAGLQHVQEHVVTQNERLEPSLQPIALMHLTMFMIHLDTEEEVTRAKRALDQCKQDLGQLYRDHLISLDISGLGNFRDKVVFAKLKTEAQETKLKEIADIIEECFRDQGILSATDHGFTAHVTVLNLSRDKNSRKRGGIKKIEPALYKKYVDTEFGRQYVNSLQLCPMMKKKAKSGYYDVEYTVQFGPDIKGNANDSVPNFRECSELTGEGASVPNFSERSELTGKGPAKDFLTNRSEYCEATDEYSASSTIKNAGIEEHMNDTIPDGNASTENDPDFEYHCKFGWC